MIQYGREAIFTWSLFSFLRGAFVFLCTMPSVQHIADAMGDNFNPDDAKRYFVRRSAKAKFHCARCKNAWTSPFATVEVRFPRRGRRPFVSKKYQQQCAKCQKAWADPSWNNEDWVSLIQSVIRVAMTSYADRHGDGDVLPPHESNKPHKSHMCEACDHGVCLYVRRRRRA